MTYDEFIAKCEQNAINVARATGWHRAEGWGIGAVGHHRDSDTLDNSNWDVVLTILNRDVGAADDETWNVLSFGHWAVGWIEELGFKLDGPAGPILFDIAQRLEDYPILDEEHYSALEWDTDHPEHDNRCYSEYCRQEESCPTGREFA